LSAEFLVLEARGRTAFSTRRVRTLFAATVVARGIGALLAAAVVAAALAFAGIGFARARIRLLGIRSLAVGLAGVRALLTLALAGKTALGEFLLRSPRGAGAPFTAGWTVAPAAGIVVFIVIAGHEWSLVYK